MVIKLAIDACKAWEAVRARFAALNSSGAAWLTEPLTEAVRASGAHPESRGRIRMAAYLSFMIPRIDFGDITPSRF